MPAPEEFENLLGTMAATEPEPLSESDEAENGDVAWYVAYTTYRA